MWITTRLTIVVRIMPLLILGVTNGCSRGISSLNDASTAGQATIEAVNFQQNILFPGRESSDSAKFLVTDTAGKPIQGVTVNFSAFDVTDLEERTSSQIAALAASGKISAAGTDGERSTTSRTDLESRVGRIVPEYAITSASGEVATTLIAPSASERVIAVLATIQKSGITGLSGRGMLLYRTSLVDGTGATNRSFEIALNNLSGREIPSGEPFALTIVAKIDGKESNLSGVLPVLLSTAAPESPWMVNTLPDNTQICAFSAGRCIISGSPFRVNGRGTLLVTATDPAGGFAAGQAEFPIVASKPTYITLSRSATEIESPCVQPGTDISLIDITACEISFSADNQLETLHALVLDAGGAPLETKPVTWTLNGSAVAQSDLSDSARVLIDISKSGKGSLQLKEGDEENSLTASYRYTVAPGEPVTFHVASQNYGLEVATTPFAINVRAFDAQDNLCTNLNDTISLSFLLELAAPSPNGTSPRSDIEEDVEFVEGMATTRGKLQSTLATTEIDAERPFIRLIAPDGEFISETIAVRAGPETNARLRSNSSNGGNILLPTTVIPLKPAEDYFVHVAGYDTYGNYARDLAVTFEGQFIDDITSGDLCDPAESENMCPLGITEGTMTVINAKPGTVGRGTFTAHVVSPAVELKSPQFIFMPDRPDILRLITSHQVAGKNTETAGEPFLVQLEAQDIYKNTVKSFSGEKELRIDVVSSPKSWLGRSGVIPSGDVTCNFVQGLCALDNQFTLADSITPVILIVAETSVPNAPSQLIYGVTGEPRELVLVEQDPLVTAREDLDAARSLMDPTDPTKPYMPIVTVDDERNFYVVVADAMGNLLPATPGGSDYHAAAALRNPTWSSPTTMTRAYPAGAAPDNTMLFTEFLESADNPASKIGAHAIFKPKRPAAEVVVEVTGVCLNQGIEQPCVNDSRKVAVKTGQAADMRISYKTIENATDGQGFVFGPNMPDGSLRFTADPVPTQAFPAGDCFGFDAFVTDQYDNIVTGYMGNTNADFIVKNVTVNSVWKRDASWSTTTETQLRNYFYDGYKHLFPGGIYDVTADLSWNGSWVGRYSFRSWQQRVSEDALADPTFNHNGGRMSVAVSQGQILWPERTLAVCLVEISSSPDTRASLVVKLDAFTDTENGIVRPAVEGHGEDLNVVPGVHSTTQLAEVTNTAYDGGFTDGTQTATWEADNPTNWELANGLVADASSIYLINGQDNLPIFTTNVDNLVISKLNILRTTISRDEHNGRAVIAGVQIDRAGNILTFCNETCMFGNENGTSTNFPLLGTTTKIKTQGINADVRTNSEVIIFVPAQKYTYQGADIVVNESSHSAKAVSITAGEPRSVAAAIRTVLFDKYRESEQFKYSLPANIHTNKVAQVNANNFIVIKYLDQFSNLALPPAAKISFSWEKDDPSFTPSANWNDDPTSFYVEERAKARRASPRNPATIMSLPESVDSVGYGEYCDASVCYIKESASPASQAIPGIPVAPLRSHCSPSFDRSTIVTEDCYTENIVVTVENSATANAPPLPATLVQRSYVLPMRVVPWYKEENSTENIVKLCNTTNCRTQTQSAIKSGATWITPSVWQHTFIGDVSYTANGTQKSVFARFLDLEWNLVGVAAGLWSGETLQGTPLFWDDTVGSRNVFPAESSLTWDAKISGQFKLKFSDISGQTLLATTGTQTIEPGDPHHLSIILWHPADSAATPPVARHMLAQNEDATASVAYEPEVRWVDFFNNTIYTYNGTASLQWNHSLGVNLTPELFGLRAPQTAVCTFSSGVCTLGADNPLMFRIPISNLVHSIGVGATIENQEFVGSLALGTNGLKVKPGPFDHFFTIPEGTTDEPHYVVPARVSESIRSLSDGSDKFYVDVCMVDAVGNLIEVPAGWTGHPDDIALSLRDSPVFSGGYFYRHRASVGSDVKQEGFTGSKTGVRIDGVNAEGEPCTRVTGLAYDTWGSFQVIASDSVPAHSSPLGTSLPNIRYRLPIVQNVYNPSHFNYASITFPATSAEVGEEINFQLVLKDKYNDTIVESAPSETNLTVTAPLSPDGTPAVITEYTPAHSEYAAGRARFYKAGTIPAAQIVFSATSGGYSFPGGTTQDLTFTAGIAELATLEAPEAEAATLAGTGWPGDNLHPFNLAIHVTDAWGNTATGPSNARIVATNPRGFIDKDGNPIQTESYAITAQNSIESITANLTTGVWNGAAVYTYGDTVDINAELGNINIVNPPTIKFYPTLRTIAYTNVFFDSATITAGDSNLTGYIAPMKHPNIPIYGLDSTMNSIIDNLTFIGYDGVINNRNAVFTNVLVDKQQFVDAKAPIIFSMFKKQRFISGSFSLKFNTADDNGSLIIGGSNAEEMEVVPSNFDEIQTYIESDGTEILLAKTDPAPLSITAGDNIKFRVRAIDMYGNHRYSEGCTVSIAPNQPYPSPGGHGGSVLETQTVDLTYDAVSGYYQGVMKFYSAETQEVTLTHCEGTRSITFNVLPAIPVTVALSEVDDSATAAHVASANCPNVAGTISTTDLRLKPHVACPTLYAFGWDIYGNAVGTAGKMSRGVWEYTDLTTDKMTPPIGVPGGSGHVASLSAISFMDGRLRFTPTDENNQPLALYAETLLSGGLSRIEIAHTDLSNAITAGSNNITINSISLFKRVNNAEGYTDLAGDVARIMAYVRGNPANRVSIEADEFQNLSLTNGVHSAPIQLSITGEGLYTLNITARDQEYVVDFEVVPSPAVSISLRIEQDIATSPLVAGVPFRIYASVRDANGNKTSFPTNGATDCKLTLSGGNTLNNSAQGFASYPPIYDGTARDQNPNQAWDDYWSNYAPWDITMYAKGPQSLTVAGCGLSKNIPVTVSQSTLQKVTLNYDNSPATAHAVDLRCTNIAANSAAVQCSPMYAFFWDVYGNAYGDGSLACESWELTPVSGTAPATPASGRMATIGHTTWIDASLKCNREGKFATTLLYGGASRMVVSNDYEDNSKTEIVAGLENLKITQIKIYQQKGGAEIDKSDAGYVPMALTATSALTMAQLGQSASYGCDFAADGTCASAIEPIAFNFSKAESPVSLTAALFGLNDTIGSINVLGAVATELVVTGIPGSVQAGSSFNVDVVAKDAFENLTANGCGVNPVDAAEHLTFAVVGGGVSPGLHGSTATPPSLPATTNQSAIGTYATSTIALHKEGANRLDVTACGITFSQNSNVTEGAVTHITVTNDATGANDAAEVVCTNPGIDASVTCGNVYAFMWDAYGNPAADASGSVCDVWQFQDLGTLGTPAGIPATATTHEFALAHTGPLDGKVRCQKNGVWGELLTYGGIVAVEVAVQHRDINDEPQGTPANYIADLPVDSILKANWDNLKVTTVTLKTSKAGSPANLGGTQAQTIAFSTVNHEYSLLNQPESYACSFVDGVCSLNWTFDFEDANVRADGTHPVKLIATVRGVAREVGPFSVIPNVPKQFYTFYSYTYGFGTGLSRPVAGKSFFIRPSIVDDFLNLTTGCGNITFTGAQASPGGHEGSVTQPEVVSPILPEEVTPGNFSIISYAENSITMYKAGLTTLTLTTENCPFTNTHEFFVDGAALNNVTLHATNSTSDAQIPTPYQCPNTGTNSEVVCPQLYAFSWDAYGNALDDGTANTCDTWGFVPYASAAMPTGVPAGAEHASLLTSPSYLDGTLTCTKTLTDLATATPVNKSVSVDLYGGVSKFEVINDYETPVQKTQIIAGNNNLNVSAIKLWQFKQGAEILKTDASMRYINIVTNSILGNNGLGVNNPYLCDFGSTGECIPAIGFDFSEDEGGPGDPTQPITLSFGVLGFSKTIDNIQIDAGVAVTEGVTITIPATVVAGESFNIGVTVKDAYGNLTNGGCEALPLTLSGGTQSPGGHGGTPTNPAWPVPADQSSLGTYATQSATLYKEGDNTVNIDLCGLTTFTRTVNVIEAPVAHVLLNNVTSAPATHKTEIRCANDNGDTTIPNVTCGTISPFFYDQYGNAVADPTNSCDEWVVSSREVANGGTLPTALTNVDGQIGPAFVLNHDSWVDSTVTCRKTGANGTKEATSLIYGGLKNIAFTVTPQPTNLLAGNDNLTISAITLSLQKNGVNVGKDDAGFKNMQLTENSSLTPAQLGIPEFPNCSFNSSGVCASSFPLDFTTVESNIDVTLSLWGKSATANVASVIAGPAHHLAVDPVATQKAGTAFSAVFRVYDVANNPTDDGCGATDTPTGYNLTGGFGSIGQHGGVATNPVLPATTIKLSTGVFQVSGINLYKRDSHSLTFYACGAPSPSILTVAVNESDLNNVTLHTTDTSTASHSAQVRCPHTGSGTDVLCGDMYAFFWDAYGNSVGGASDQCDSWSWTDRTGDGAPSTTPAVSADASHSKTVGHTSHLNGDLVCTRTVGGITKSNSATNLYGGISRMEIATSHSGSPIDLSAALDNFTLQNISLFMKKGNAEIPMESAGTLGVTIVTDYDEGLAGLGVSSPYSCAFNATTGVCVPNLNFDFTKVQSGRSLSFTVRTNFAKTVSTINVIPNTPSDLTVDPLGTVAVNEAFRPTVHLKDAQSNYTTVGCDASNKITWSAAPTSNGIPGQPATATAPIYSTPLQISTTGAIAIDSDIKLYAAGTYNLTITACGHTNNAVPITVTADPFAAITLNTASTDDPNGTPVTSAICAQNATNDPNNSNISCPTVRAFFWDQYGNQLDAPANTCDTWTWSPYGSSDTPAGGMVASGHTIAPTHTRWIDGKLTCEKTLATVTLSKEIDIYGGAADFITTTPYAGTAVAANPNLDVSNITLQWYKQGSLISKTDATGGITAAISTTSAVNTVPASQNYTFASGVVNNPTSFAFTTVETLASKISMKIFNIEKDVITNINITPNKANSLIIAAPGSATAGTTINASVDIKDAFGNLTTLDKTSGNCGSLVIVGAQNSPNGTTPTTAAVGNITVPGQYPTVPLTLVWEGSETLTFSACGLSDDAIVNVGEETLDSVRLSTTSNDATPPANLGTPLYCDFTVALATANNIACSTVYAYALDTYGNPIGNATNPCDTWSYTPKSGGGDDLDDGGAGHPAFNNAAKSQTLTHDNFVDGDLTCTKGAMSATLNLYGGVESVTVASTNPALPATIYAGDNNLAVTAINLYTRRGAAQVDLPNTANQTITWATDATNTSNSVFGGSATSSCSFATGLCNTAKNLSFTTAPEAARSVTLTVRGKSTQINGITIDPNNATTIAVNPPLGAQIAGTPFTATVEVKDAKGNLTTRDCGDLSITGGNNSPFTDTPVLPADVVQTGTGTYTTGNITLKAAGNNSLTFSACGLDTTPTVAVNPAAQSSVRLSTTNNESSPPAHTTEIYCALNAGTTNNTTCPTLYAYNLDAFGNATAGATACSSWTWTGEAGSLSPGGVPGAAGRTAALTGTNGFLDGTLRCNTVAGMNNSTIVYGGIESLDIVTHTQKATNPIALTAANGNFTMGNLQINTQKEGSPIALPAAADGEQSIALSVSSGTLAELTATATPQNCTFASGVCASPWGSLNFTQASAGKTISLTVRGVSYITDTITVAPATPHHLTVTSPAAASDVVAGSSFDTTIEVRDQFENVATNDATCTTLSTSIPDAGAGASPNGTAATLTNAANHAAGIYTISGLSLVKEDSNTLRFSVNGCGLTAVDHALNVTENTLNAVYLSTTNSDANPPTSNLAQLRCELANASPSSNGTVTCVPIYAYSLDAYGNPIGNTASPCDTWAYVAKTSGGTANPTITNTAKSHTVSHSAFFDGDLKCTKGETTATTNIYGGVSRVQVTAATSTATPIITTDDNFAVTGLAIFMRKGGGEVNFEVDGEQRVDVSTAYAGGLAALGFTTPQDCAFTAGACAPNYTFDFNNSAINTSITFTVRGQPISITGINVNTPASLALDPTPKEFDIVPNNSTRDQVFTLTNNGQTEATSISGGVLNAPYSYQGGTYPGTDGTCDATLAAGDDCDIVVTYAPTTVATHTGTLSVSYNNGMAGGQSATSALSGTAKTPAILTISDNTYNFGNVVLNQMPTKVLTISNPAESYRASSVVISGYTGAFTQTDTTCGATLAGDASCTVTVQFKPTTTDTQNFTLNVAYNDGNGAQNATHLIGGTGVNAASITASPASWAAGTVTAGSLSEETVTFSNASVLYAKATNISFSALNSQFRFKGDSGSCFIPEPVTELAAGASCTAVIEYAPTTAQADSSTLQINYNNGASDTNSQVALTGTAQPAAAATVTAALTAAGTKTAESPFTLSLTVKDAYNNLTDSGCNVSNISVAGATASSGDGDGTATSPVFPTTMSKNSTGSYVTDNITLYNAEESPSLAVTACGQVSAGVAVTVQPAATLNFIWLTDTDAEPGSHTATDNCGDGTSLDCTLYAYGWDAYGNSLPSQAANDTFQCNTWSFNNTSGQAAPTLSASSSAHATSVTQSSYHIAGNLTCTVGDESNSTTLSGRIHRDYQLSCAALATPTQIDCTVTNSTNYEASFVLSPSQGSAGAVSGACTTGTGACTSTTITGCTATQSVTINVSATETDNAIVNLLDPAAPAATVTCP